MRIVEELVKNFVVNFATNDPSDHIPFVERGLVCLKLWFSLRILGGTRRHHLLMLEILL
jgi:hypothetical protein